MSYLTVPPRIENGVPRRTPALEFSLEDAILNSWVEDTSVYLRLDADVVIPTPASSGGEEPDPQTI